jgi:hypothetical protein
LREERGLAYGSIRNMMPFVDRFLAQKYPRNHFDFAALKVDDITSFVRKQATELGSVQAKHMVSSLRAFSDTCGIVARSIQISRAVSLVSRLIRSLQFRDFFRRVLLRKSCAGRFEPLPADGAITRF